MALWAMGRQTHSTLSPSSHRLIGLAVTASALRAEDPGFESRLHQYLSGLSHTSDLKIGTPVATLPGAWHYRVSAGTLDGLVSVYCDWVRWKEWSATSVSVWQHGTLSEKIRLWDTFASVPDTTGWNNGWFFSPFLFPSRDILLFTNLVSVHSW